MKHKATAVILLISSNDWSLNQILYPNTTIINTQNLQRTAVQNISQALYNKPGVQLLDTFGNNSIVAVGIRGFSSNASSNSLIVVNGFRLINPDLAAPDLNSIPVQDIQRIEIIPGSACVLYGDQAVGGVVNIITKQPQHFIFHLGSRHASYTHYAKFY